MGNFPLAFVAAKLRDTMLQQKLSIVTGPWSKVEPSAKGHFFGEQSMHCLLFKPLYNSHFFSFKVAVVERLNCTFVC